VRSSRSVRRGNLTGANGASTRGRSS